jgi:hypothetical protein
MHICRCPPCLSTCNANLYCPLVLPIQELLDLLRADPKDHMWYCLYCEESIPSAPFR